MHLGELVNPDIKKLRNPLKVIKHTTVLIPEHYFQFFLPGHKADKFFEGNTILLSWKPHGDIDTYHQFSLYLASRDKLFPYSSPLWLRSNGAIPTRSWFINCLHSFFTKNIAGQSLQAGGATRLAETGSPPSLIQAIG